MTIVNIIVRPEYVHVVVDAVGMRKTGEVGAFVDKIFPLPSFNAVIAGRGNHDLSTIVAQLIRRMPASNFDELKSCIGQRLCNDIETLKVEWKRPVEDGMWEGTFFLCGFNEHSGRAETYLVSTWARDDDFPPWIAHELPYGMLTPPIADPWWHDVVHHADPLSLMPAILAEQRRLLEGTTKEMPYVGGYVTVATVGRQSIKTRIMGAWPDAAEQPLDPETPFEEWPETTEAEAFAAIGVIGTAEIDAFKAWFANGCAGPRDTVESPERQRALERVMTILAGERAAAKPDDASASPAPGALADGL